MTPLLVFPVSGDAEFRHAMHLDGADLHLDRPVAADHGRVQGLVAVRLGETDVVLETTGNRSEAVMHHRQSAIAGLDTGRDDPKSRHVIDLVEGLLVALHLAPDAVEVLRTSADLTS